MAVPAQTAIAAATERLKAARRGVDDMRAGPERNSSGLMNAVMLGRTVTLALQNMRGAQEGFDEWYAPHQDRMKADPTMRYFIDLRNSLEKQAEMPTYASTYVPDLGTALRAFGTPPPGAVAQFIGDRYGRSGWMIALPDGTEDQYFVVLPRHLAETKTWFKTDIEELAGLEPADAITIYLDRLEEVVRSARSHFPAK